MNRQICPYCDDYKDVIKMEHVTVVKVRGRDILVNDKYLKCLDCNNKFDDPKDKYDVLEQAYLKHNELYPFDQVKIKTAEDVKKDMGL